MRGTTTDLALFVVKSKEPTMQSTFQSTQRSVQCHLWKPLKDFVFLDGHAEDFQALWREQK